MTCIPTASPAVVLSLYAHAIGGECDAVKQIMRDLDNAVAYTSILLNIPASLTIVPVLMEELEKLKCGERKSQVQVMIPTVLECDCQPAIILDKPEDILKVRGVIEGGLIPAGDKIMGVEDFLSAEKEVKAAIAGKPEVLVPRVVVFEGERAIIAFLAFKRDDPLKVEWDDIVDVIRMERRDEERGGYKTSTVAVLTGKEKKVVDNRLMLI